MAGVITNVRRTSCAEPAKESMFQPTILTRALKTFSDFGSFDIFVLIRT